MRPDPDGAFALGELPLSTDPLETLGPPLVTERASFYTLGHNRLKFFDPAPLFELPALEIGRCASREDIERSLRRSWALAQLELRKAKLWLEQLGSDIGSSLRGTRLMLALTGIGEPHVIVRSQKELLIPSAGPLRDHSLATPIERRFRPFGRFDHASELELAIGHALERLAASSGRTRAPEAAPQAPPQASVEAGDPTFRLLVVDGDSDELAAAEGALHRAGCWVSGFREPTSALASFESTTYDAVLTDARLDRMNGLELAIRVHELPGIEELPVVLIDRRPTEANRQAAERLPATAYLGRPADWNETAEFLVGMLRQNRRRRYTRFETRIALEVLSGRTGALEVVEQVSRGGFGLRARGDLRIGAIERCRVRLPPPRRPIELEAQVLYRDRVPGQTSVRAGARIARFLDGSEPLWLELIASLARRKAGLESGPDD